MELAKLEVLGAELYVISRRVKGEGFVGYWLWRGMFR